MAQLLDANPTEQDVVVSATVYRKRKVGDILWVREAFCSADMGPVRRGGPIAYRADYTAERIERGLITADHLRPEKRAALRKVAAWLRERAS